MEWVKKPDPVWTCSACSSSFPYYRIDNQMSGSWYVYCADCGTTGLLEYVELVPPSVLKRCGYELSQEAETFLPSCKCGGAFRHGSAPLCPKCKYAISRDEIIRMLDAFYEKTEWSAASDKLGSLQSCVIIDKRLQWFSS